MGGIEGFTGLIMKQVERERSESRETLDGSVGPRDMVTAKEKLLGELLGSFGGEEC